MPKIDALIAERIAAKKARDFARADEIRAELADQGVILEDTKEGVRWKRVMKIRKQNRSLGRPQEGRQFHSRHHADLYRLELRLRIDGAARPRLRPRRSRVRPTRATTIRRQRAGGTGARARKRRTARWPAPRA